MAIKGISIPAPGIFVNVRDFGATGNGKTDDHPSIQAALDFIASKSGDGDTNDGTLYFPEGTYLDVHFVNKLPGGSDLDNSRGLWDLQGNVTEIDLFMAATSWMSPMPFPFAERVSLTDVQRAELEALVRAHSTPQALAFRCRLILRASDKDNPTNLQIAAEFNCERHTVALWRNRYLAKGLAGLQDASRSGRPRRFSPLGTTHCDHVGQQHDRATGLPCDPVVVG